MTEKKLVRVSSRGTVSLGSLADNEFYYAFMDRDGRIILDPVAVLPASQVPIRRKVDDEQR